MSGYEEEKLQTLRGQVLNPGDPMYEPMSHTPSPPGHAGIFNVYGALKLHANKRGYQRVQAMLEAQEGAYLAYTNVVKAKVAVRKAEVSLRPDALEEIKETERNDIRHEREQSRLRLDRIAGEKLKIEAEVIEQKYKIAKQKADLASLEHEEELRRLRREVEIQELKEKLHGTPKEETNSDELRYREVMDRFFKMQDEFAAAQRDPNFSDSDDGRWKEKMMAIHDEIDALNR